MIELKQVSFTYSSGEKENSLSDISLSIGRGEVVLLCGESGCGKTTVTRLINGLIPHYFEGKLEGSVSINGQDIGGLPLYETAKLVGSVFQNPRTQFFNVDTTSELAFGAENLGLPAGEIEERVEHTVREFGIHNLMGRSIFKLSGGEKQKIACASVAVCDPLILVMDEPSSNLDVATIEELRRLIALWKRQGKTIVIAEHRLYFLRDLADRVIYLRQGRIEKEFRMEELRQLSNTRLSDMGLRPLSLEGLKRKSGTAQGAGMLTVNDFVYCYKHASAPSLDIRTMEVPQGGIIAVIGNNGAGKSTFARCLCGLEKACKGRISLQGRQFDAKKRLKQCFMVMQDVNHQLFTESVLDEVLLSLREEEEEQAQNILSGLDLLSMQELHPLSLSGGQKQRVAIASAVASNRDIIIFDEPTSGLDLRHMKEVSESFRQLNRQGKTLFIISHDLELIFECCTHILHFEKGKIADSYSLNSEGEEKLKKFFISALNT